MWTDKPRLRGRDQSGVPGQARPRLCDPLLSVQPSPCKAAPSSWSSGPGNSGAASGPLGRDALRVEWQREKRDDVTRAGQAQPAL